MTLMQSFSLFQVLTAAVLLFASIILTLGVRKDAPASLRRDLKTTAGLIFFFFAGYIFFGLIMLGNISYPLEPVTTSMLLGSACFVYADIMLIRAFTRKIKENDGEIERYAEKLKERTASLENEIAERKKAEEALLLLEKAASTTNTGITVRTFDGEILYTNQADAEMHGYTTAEVLGKDVGIFAAPGMRKPIEPRQMMEATGKTWMRESINARKDGSEFPVKLVSDIVRNESGGPIGIVTTCEDITERKRTEEKLALYQNQLENLVKERTQKLSEVVGKLENEVRIRRRTEEQITFLAYYDSLTSLPNRILFLDRLGQAVEYAKRHERLVAVLFLDLDNFKNINDTLGHNIGDHLLQGVAERLSSCLRSCDSFAYVGKEGATSFVSRLGGDEFVILLTEINGVQDAAVIAQRIIEVMAQPYKVAQQDVFTSASIGITIYPLHGEDPGALLKNADMAMYLAKEQGRNNYQFFTHTMNELAFEKLAMDNNLRMALARDEFLLHYQPQVGIPGREIICMEALIRWRRQGRGLISPSEFIPVAEENGLIVPIGEWVLRTACSQNMAWQSRGLKPVRVAVNLSSYQFRQQRLVDTIANAMKEHMLDPEFIELELTESIIMQNAEDTISTLKQLKDMGIKISIDDFGTGYSSLSYLKRFPIDTLKIDSSFVRDIVTNADDAAITRTIIAMAHNLNLSVVAEGVETEEQLAFLEENGCDAMQGYLFSRPVPSEDIAALLAREDQGGPGFRPRRPSL